MDGNRNRIHLYSEITPTKVSWLWYPYIPFGKITILQGDPGDGKSTMMMDIIARLTTGKGMPDGDAVDPIKVIYQCNEDGLCDTIRPRLEKAHADCSMVGFIDEESNSVFLDDEVVRNAITYMGAGLLVIDPFQAYLGDTDMANATSIRRILRRIGIWASTYRCAVVLIGHLNKKSGTKELYRGLGSIDVVASARSVLQIERDESNPNVRIIKHIKSSLAPRGNDKKFSISENGEVVWIDESEIPETVEAPHCAVTDETDKEKVKIEKAAEYISERLSSGSVDSTSMLEELTGLGIKMKTIKTTKKILGIQSVRVDKKWYWALPADGANYGKEI